jgi:hypothetical protein
MGLACRFVSRTVCELALPIENERGNLFTHRSAFGRTLDMVLAIVALRSTKLLLSFSLSSVSTSLIASQYSISIWYLSATILTPIGIRTCFTVSSPACFAIYSVSYLLV